MARRPIPVTQADITRAIKAANDIGAYAVELSGADEIRVISHEGDEGKMYNIRELSLNSGSVVYFIRCGDFVKIGTTINLEQRIASMLTDNPIEVELLHTVPGSIFEERQYHYRFKTQHHRREWFRYDGGLKSWIEKRSKRQMKP